MANKVFSGGQWIFTPEKMNTRYTKDGDITKIPDYTIEEFHTVYGKETTTPVLFMEFKSHTGDRFEQALIVSAVIWMIKTQSTHILAKNLLIV